MLQSPLLTKPFYRLRRIGRRLWVRTTLIAALALVSALMGPALDGFVPEGLATRLAPGSVARILEILASSMLAVTTFSLSVMVVARQWASSQSTPRAHRVVREDPVTQNALATFLGAFVFSLVSLILVEIDVYSEGAVTVILAFTLVVIFLVVIAILRWIDHLSDLGGVSETARKVEDRTRDALKREQELPCLGAHPCRPEDMPTSGPAVTAHETGLVQHVDASRLDEIGAEAGGRIWIAVLPGTFVCKGDVLARASVSVPEDRVRSAFVLGDGRGFEQDPRFGLVVLSEIAQRALSPGVNDPGTAISIVERLVRLLLPFRSPDPKDVDDVRFPHVSAPPLRPSALVDDAFAAIARDAAEKVEVHVVVQTALARLSASDDPAMAAAARGASERALLFARKDLPLAEDLEQVERVAPSRGAHGRGEAGRTEGRYSAASE